MIHTELCIGCGLCVKDCPAGSIALVDGTAQLISERCIRCGHCTAICPTGAMDIDAAPLASQTPCLPTLEADRAEDFLRSRRSMRQFAGPADREVLTRLINIGRFAQTGGNRQGIRYVVVDGRDKVMHLADMLADYFEAKGTCEHEVARHRRGEDVFFRGAPQLIFACAPTDAGSKHDNAYYSLTYMELFAPTLGLGTCWAGYFEGLACGDDGHLVREYLGISDDLRIFGVLMCGKAAVKYRRLPDRDPLVLDWV